MKRQSIDLRFEARTVGDVVEGDACGRMVEQRVDPSILRVSFTVVGVWTLILNAVLGGVAAVVLIRTFLCKVATRAVVGGGLEVFPCLGHVFAGTND